MTGRLLAFLLSVLLCSLTGCIGVKQLSQLPPDLQLKEIAKVDADAPLAVSRTGKVATVLEGGIDVIAPDGKVEIVTPGTAADLAFSPDGGRIAVAQSDVTGSTLRLIGADGTLLAEATVPERVTAVAWNAESQVVAAALAIKRSGSTAELTSTLYVWNGDASPAATRLGAVDIGSQLAKLADPVLYGTFGMSVSPFGDEIAYSALKAPAGRLPYLAIYTRRLDTGGQREVAKTSLGSGCPIYAPDGESLLVGDAHSVTRRIALPSGREIYAWPAQGSFPAVSPSAVYVYLDGRLYRDGNSFASFPPLARGVFTPDGSAFVLTYQGKLYRVSGLNDRGGPTPEYLRRVRELRRLRSQGQISEKQFKIRKHKIDTESR